MRKKERETEDEKERERERQRQREKKRNRSELFLHYACFSRIVFPSLFLMLLSLDLDLLLQLKDATEINNLSSVFNPRLTH